MQSNYRKSERQWFGGLVTRAEGIAPMWCIHSTESTAIEDPQPQKQGICFTGCLVKQAQRKKLLFLRCKTSVVVFVLFWNVSLVKSKSLNFWARNIRPPSLFRVKKGSGYQSLLCSISPWLQSFKLCFFSLVYSVVKLLSGYFPINFVLVCSCIF